MRVVVFRFAYNVSIVFVLAVFAFCVQEKAMLLRFWGCCYVFPLELFI